MSLGSAAAVSHKLPPGGGYRIGDTNKRESFTNSITSIIEESEEESSGDQLDEDRQSPREEDRQELFYDNAAGGREDTVFYSFMSTIAEEERDNSASMNVDDVNSNAALSFICKMESRRKFGTILPGTIGTHGAGLEDGCAVAGGNGEQYLVGGQQPFQAICDVQVGNLYFL